MSCKHVDSADLRPPGPVQSVYREDCTQCFDSIDDPTGLDVCLYCFNGGCTGERKHAALHSTTRHHPLVLNIKRTRRVVERDEPPQKISKIAIAAETEADRYNYETTVRCYECNVDNVDKNAGKLAAVVEGVMKANTFSRQEEVKAWEQEFTSCEHILMLQQQPPRKIESQDLGHCSLCELQENLWLCLECGNLGCGRAQFGGVSGHSHGLEHKNTIGHAVAVKLGSITPEGTADVYCYACDEERIDKNLGGHLANWGIILAERQKTEQSLTEMNVEQNLRWDFSMTDESGGELKKLFGQGFTGLKNLGNSCYMASTIQCLFSLPQFQARYYLPGSELPTVEDPAQDLETQLRKLGDGLLSGRYSNPDPDAAASGDNQVPYQKGLAPAMLKYLIGRGHVEFSTMRQQDAFEFLLHVFKLVTRSKHTAELQDPVRSFRFVMEQRLQCLSCKKVRYSTDEQDNISIPVPIRKIIPPASNSGEKPSDDKKDEYESVTLKECLDSFTSSEHVELTCSSCGSRDGFLKRSLFKTFPEVLAINARRFNLINWVPTKVDVPVVVGDESFLLDDYRSPGHQPSEELLPEEVSTSTPSFVANPEAVQMLEGMGFPRVRCERALHATGNADGNAAMEWLFGHMDDPDINQPLDLGGGGQAAGTADPEKIEMLGAMGFGPPQARKALKETGGDLERAVEWLFNHPDDQGDFGDEEPAAAEPVVKEFPGSSKLPAKFQLQSIICHKGASIHAGHYVAFIRKAISGQETPAWVLYNDEKVVQATDIEEMKKFAYVYFFQHA
ncbi:Ubiquitin carboxyl-terminal hydrolase [Lachnellula hyalina]|uniref:Ubiquitin carboxyl-terminal hydrolase n=1 Tax=Lachnellula hyalina TaxID=1316788 RepID=A0A8H8R8T9_9HELO|nr:Ubiquitin carboxyl-terminal hydrolase [Lachnellula hyalina]TVY30601.1 Ubiquitin carboxyl-terminal hydrolase [Lachnellula hyalina]